ncbi:MAG: hypothetical protein ACOYOQ_16085, partial [Microthrixaceae bacterium]
MSIVDGERVWSAELLGEVAAPEPGQAATRFRDAGGWQVLVHHDGLEQLTGEMDEARRKRVQYCLRELLAHGICNRRKIVKGVNRGWQRTQLGGTGGSHYYLWWAQSSYPPVADLDLGEQTVLVRAIRHHDKTSDWIGPGTPDDWDLLTPAEALSGSTDDLTDDQQAVVDLNGPPIRVVRGYPGSGKTTALLEAATKDWGEQVLYLTFSGRLQSLAEQQLRAFTPDGVNAESMTFGQMMALLGASGPGVEQPITLPKLIDRLERALQDYRGKLGKWERRIPELYAQLHAHAFGQALPIEFDGVPASRGEVLDKRTFVDLRRSSLGKGTAEKVVEVAQFLIERDRFAECFPGIHAARCLLDESSDELPAAIAGAAVVLVDEVQDLTMVEAMLVLSVVGRIARDRGRMPYLFVAGDESQTVRPTAFTWKWFAKLMSATLGPVADRRTDIDLRSNLRSPRVVADLIQATRSHYRLLDRDDRPGGMVYEDPEIDRTGRLFYCHAPGDDWPDLVELFRSQPSAQLV